MFPRDLFPHDGENSVAEGRRSEPPNHFQAGERSLLRPPSATNESGHARCVRSCRGTRYRRRIERITPWGKGAIVRELSPARSTVGTAQAIVPNSAPTPAVSAMARAPQNVTRIAPTVTPAPPARAATPPRSARNTSEVPETRGISPALGVMAVTKRGRAAPTAKLPADAIAACIGRPGSSIPDTGEWVNGALRSQTAIYP